MFQTLRDAFKIKDLRRRIGFTFLMLIVVRLGSLLPVPGVDSSAFESLFGEESALNFFDAVTGGSFAKMSVFALNITPYITSSIIMQLLTIAFPKLEEMQRDGEAGRKKMTQITRYLTIALALGESIAMTIGFTNGGYIKAYSVPYLSQVLIVASLTAGSAVLMWIGERITERGIGNGISIVLVINIISRIPVDLANLYDKFMKGKTPAKATLAGIIIAAIIIALVLFVVVLQSAERRIPVQYSNKIQGRRQVGGNSSVIPIRINTAGVIPVIFAQSILSTPGMILRMLNKNVTGFWGKVLSAMDQSHWFSPANWVDSIGAIVYVLMIIGFAYFYTEITFNPLEVAENLKRSGGFIPGIRPGKPTSDYLTAILKHVIFIGAIGLSIVALLPLVSSGLLDASVSFGGTSIIIIVGVIVETLKQVESQMMVRNYKGFLND